MGKMKLSILTGIRRCVFILGLFSLICIIFLKFYSLKPFLIFDTKCIYDTKPQVNYAPQIDILNTVIKKIEHEISDVRDSHNDSPYALKYGSFLSDILGLIEAAKSGGPEDEVITATNRSQPVHMSPDFFLTEEIRKYVRIKPNRLGKQNFMGANGTFTSIGHACFSMKEELEEYMNYDVGEICNDDWKLAQKLMVHGCDPLPRRRCLSVAPKLYTKPLPTPESIWSLPDDKNVRWNCFNLTHHESPRWVVPVYPDPNSNSTPDFRITEVLDLKPDEIRIGLDFSVGTGTFAARMREHNVTIVSAALNLGAPFSEMIALRGLVPLYMTINQRLPFFDNTLDLIHTTRFLDGWIDFVLLDFVLYDWDRVLRPGGLLWIDSFFCLKEDLYDYLEAFKMLRYKKHKWVVVPKVDKDDDREVFFSAVLEKPPRPF
ncbi:probable methyltransferase At1g29790 [Rutidosis leptorrhynchoides]|uniref:probable methyltransferase At1g29790 n=1 Tax=Rutidosis leptorrhynchoides TaxID=125765 RepID=UPI003A99C2E9